MHLLDANVFIQAKNLHYRFSTFPCFWEWLDFSCQMGDVASIASIKAELCKGNDELAQWAKDVDTSWFLDESDEQTQLNLIEIVNYVGSGDYRPFAIDDFLSGADPLLIAKAKAMGATIVTQEKSDPKSRKKVFIPDVCNEFGVPYLDTYDLLENLKARF